MKFQRHLLRITILIISSTLAIIAIGVVKPACATELGEMSPAEHYVLEKVRRGKDANLDYAPIDDSGELSHVLRASFVAKLLTGDNGRFKTGSVGMWIQNAEIEGDLDLREQVVPNNVVFENCTFGWVNLAGSHFLKDLDFDNSTFTGGVDASKATVDGDFFARGCSFQLGADFRGMRIAGAFVIDKSSLPGGATFQGSRVAGDFSIQGCNFGSSQVSFEGMRVDGAFSAQGSHFNPSTGIKSKFDDPKEYSVVFRGAHLTEVFLNAASFENVATIDFSRMHVDLLFLDDIEIKTPTEIRLQQMTFKAVSPVNSDKLQFLLSHYNAQFYSDLETSFRIHGYSDEADKIYVAKRRAERRENCKSFLHQCGQESWAWSMFQDALSGYGRHLENLLYWSLGFLVIGTFVFRSEKGMRIKDEKDTPHYAGRYNAFWYSLDLFLPIIKLGEADVWTPKDDRRWANLYRKVHIIIGSLFVPIGLAALTGIIK